MHLFILTIHLFNYCRLVNTGRGPVAIHSSGQTISSLAHIEGMTLGAGEEVDEIAGGAGGMGVDGIGEVGDRASVRDVIS